MGKENYKNKGIPCHGASSKAHRQNPGVQSYPFSSLYLYPYSGPCDDACASYALYPYPYLYPYAFYVSSPCLWNHLWISH